MTYIKEVQMKLTEEFGIKNPMALPKLKKIVISVGLGEAKDNAGVLEKVQKYISAIAGQKALTSHAKKSIAAFKVVVVQPVGVNVTLRGERMYAFLDKFMNIVLPKVRDFRGLSDDSFDGKGNLNIGLREQTIFPEVDYKMVDKTRGMAITIVTTAGQKDLGKKLLELLGFPFKKSQESRDKSLGGDR